MLAGDRVTLRPLTPDNYPRLLEFKNDVELELLGGGDPPRPRTLATMTEFYDGLVASRTDVTFAIEADGSLIGDAGLFHFQPPSRTAELGIGIGDRAYWGRGYGREAVRLLVDYGFTMHNLRKIWLATHGSNQRAIRCYLAAGFAEEGRQREHVWSGGRYEDLVLMAAFRH
jgi:RimJ/RimL family protein N-acetyltransferase